MKAGDTIVCRGSRGYMLTTGKEYTVVRYEAAGPAFPNDAFIWPAYVEVIDDEGKTAWCHANRFEVTNEPV